MTKKAQDSTAGETRESWASFYSSPKNLGKPFNVIETVTAP